MLKHLLKGRVALVTGGASGIGRAVVEHLIAAGANVAVNDQPDRMKAVAAVTKKWPSAAMWCPGDVRTSAMVDEVVANVESRWGGLDVVVNCAGITRDGWLWSLSDEDWQNVMDVNLKGTFHVIRAASRIFRRQKSGAVVNITSINGMRGKAGQANYTASKAGVIGLTKTAARELGRYGVRVNAVAPGWIDTPMTKRVPPEFRKRAMDESALGKVGCVDDVSSAVVFLCSPWAAHITGQVLQVDGGQYL